MLYLAVILPFIVNFMPIKNKKLKVLIAIAPAIYIILFRFGLGTDYFSYQFLYNNHDVSSFSAAMSDQARSMEVGFRFLIYIFKVVGFPFQFFVASISLTIYGLFLKWLNDVVDEKNFILSIMLLNGMFFIVWALGGLRQGLVLAIGTYFLFNPKVNLSVIKKVLLIAFLTLFHQASIIYLVFIVVKEISFKKWQLILITIFSLILTIVPYYKLFIPFEDIRIVKKFLTYVTGNLGFWDFPGLVRLAFVLFIFIFYNKFEKEEVSKSYAKLSIVGFSFYFILKSSEITASRISIFTFILIIPLFLSALEVFKNYKKLHILGMVALFLFSMAYLEKDLIANQREVGKKNTSLYYSFRHYFNIDYEDYLEYDNQYSFLAFNAGNCIHTKKISNPILLPVEEKGNISVKATMSDQYGLIDETGNWVVSPNLYNKPDVYGDVIAYSNYGLYDTYYNLDMQKAHKPLQTVYKYQLTESLIENESAKESEISIDKYSSFLKTFSMNLEKVKYPTLLTYYQPFEHNILKLQYSNNKYYFYLDENLDVTNNLIFNKEIRFNHNNLAYAQTFCGNVVLNSNGDVIYK